VQGRHFRAEPVPLVGSGAAKGTRSEACGNALTLKRRAVGFLKIGVTVGALKLTPRLATGMTISADIPPAWPAIIGAMVLRAKVVLCVDRAAPTLWECQQRRRRIRRLEAKCNGVFTRVTAWLMDQSRKGCGLFGAFLDGLCEGRRRLERCRSSVSPYPTPEHSEPKPGEHQQRIEERIVSHGASLPSCWKGDIAPD
jgi:hypothetical protein